MGKFPLPGETSSSHLVAAQFKAPSHDLLGLDKKVNNGLLDQSLRAFVVYFWVKKLRDAYLPVFI